MPDVLKFPNQMKSPSNPYSGELPPLLGLPRLEVMERVFEKNIEFLGLLEEGHPGVTADGMEFFIDDRYPARILVDIDDLDHRPGIRGLYSVNLETFDLEKMRDKPLLHFEGK